MRIGFALPQYDYSVPGDSPLRWETLLAHAQRAEELGFDSVWVPDHFHSLPASSPDLHGTQRRGA